MKFAGQYKPASFTKGFFKGTSEHVKYFKYTPVTGSRRVPYADKTMGRGDLGVPGSNANGNTYNAVGNGQRDAPMTDYRSSAMPGEKRSTRNNLESRKRNKLN